MLSCHQNGEDIDSIGFAPDGPSAHQHLGAASSVTGASGADEDILGLRPDPNWGRRHLAPGSMYF